MKDRIVGREIEKDVLTSLYQSNNAEFLAVYGRRRVGKTYLVREFFEDTFAFYHTALSPFELKDQPKLLYRAQLDEFAHSLRKYGDTKDDSIDNWFEAFHRLEALLDGKKGRKRMVVFIDEMPWLDTPRAGFMSAFEHFWNGWGAGKHNLLLIVCGSATTWMLDKLIHNTGGLYGRTTRELHLKPFSLHQTEKYCKSMGLTMDRYDILQSYMILGGVPYYWSYFRKGTSLAKNVDDLFFSSGGKLADEFDNLFTSLFGDRVKYRTVVEALSKSRYGMTREQIAGKVEMASGGDLSEILKSLEKSDLISSYYNFGETKRNRYFKLTDPFCLFYLNFVQKHPTSNKSYWQDNQFTPKVNTWRGLAFEDVCFVHQDEIRSALGIRGVQAEVYPWRTGGEGKTDGAQIDMLIDRADRVMNVCEIKFSRSEFEIDKNYEADLRRKVDAVLEHAKNRRTPIMTLITTYGLKYNMYSSRIQKVVLMDDLFREE